MSCYIVTNDRWYIFSDWVQQPDADGNIPASSRIMPLSNPIPAAKVSCLQFSSSNSNQAFPALLLYYVYFWLCCLIAIFPVSSSFSKFTKRAQTSGNKDAPNPSC